MFVLPQGFVKRLGNDIPYLCSQVKTKQEINKGKLVQNVNKLSPHLGYLNLTPSRIVDWDQNSWYLPKSLKT